MSRYRGRQRPGEDVVYRGFQLQIMMRGSLTYLGNAWESITCGLLAVAVGLDPRLGSEHSLFAWALWMVETGDAAVDAWLQNPVVREALEEETAHARGVPPPAAAGARSRPRGGRGAAAADGARARPGGGRHRAARGGARGRGPPSRPRPRTTTPRRTTACGRG